MYKLACFCQYKLSLQDKFHIEKQNSSNSGTKLNQRSMKHSKPYTHLCSHHHHPSLSQVSSANLSVRKYNHNSLRKHNKYLTLSNTFIQNKFAHTLREKQIRFAMNPSTKI